MADSHAADVQAELQQYLNSKQINSIFIQIVESILIEKPENPIAFIIEYLQKQYPDQTKGTLSNSDQGQAVAAAAPADETALDSDDEDDEDDVEDMPEFVPQAKPKGRRTSVSAESMDPSKLKAQISEVKNIPKDPTVEKTLSSIISKSPLLRTLDAEQRKLIVNAFDGPEAKSSGEDIIVQGEVGDTFYLLEEGEVDVYIAKDGAEPNKVHAYKPGDAFGELAIMYNAPRAATCRASTSCKLWKLDRVSFKVIVVAAAMQKREQYIGFLKEVPILKSLNETELMTLADSLIEEKFEAGTTIFNQNETGDFFYIIKEGNVICSQKDATGTDKEVANLTAGNYFGEVALLTRKPRQATVKAVLSTVVLAIDRATFQRIMGNLEEIMKRNMEEYNKYAAAGI